MWIQLICVLCPFVYTYIYTYTYIFCNIFPTTSCWNTRDSLGLVTSRPGLVYRRRPPSAPLPASHCTSGTMLCVCRVCVSYKWINKFFHCKDQMFYLFLFIYLCLLISLFIYLRTHLFSFYLGSVVVCVCVCV